MKQVFACLLLLFVWDISAASRPPSPDMKDDEESVSVVDIVDSSDASKDTVIDIPPDSLTVQYPAFVDICGVSSGGVNWVNGRAASIFRDLTEDQKRCVISCALSGNFSPGSVSVKFWKFVSYISDPIGNLAKVAVVVLPLLSSSGYYGVVDSEASEGYGQFAARMGIATSVAGIVSLTFDKICGYANDKIANQEKVAICLQAMKSEKKGG